MKITRVSEHIYRLGIWFIIPINVWIVVGDDGIAVVDTGLSLMASKILRFVERLGKGSLTRILLTHGHSDHVGGVLPILAARKVPVSVHPIEIPYMEGRISYPRRKKAAASLPAGIATALELDEDGKLKEIGDLVPVHTPGHAPGHVAYFHKKDGILLAGDLFTSKKGRLRLPMPMFTADMREAVRSAEVVRVLRPKALEVCHGGPVSDPAEQLDEYAAMFGRTRFAAQRGIQSDGGISVSRAPL